MRRNAIATACLLGLLGVCATMAGNNRSVQSNTDADAAEIRRLTQEFVQGFNSGDLDRMMRFYADRYVDVNLRQPVQSKAERREYYRKIVEPQDVTVAVTPEEIVVSGAHAFARGTIVLHRKTQGTTTTTRELRYIEIWQKFPDGWKSIWGIDAELYPETK